MWAGKMAAKDRKRFLALGILAFLFPVLVTVMWSKIIKVKDNKKDVSDKIIIIDEKKYAVSLDMEDFIPCVLMAQMSEDSPKEALKAQAVVIRTYILKQMGKNKEIKASELGLPFLKFEEMRQLWFLNYKLNKANTLEGIMANITGLGGGSIFLQNYEYLRNVTEKTKSMVLKKDGNLILPLFHEISNGATRSGKEVLGKSYGILKSVECKTDLKEEQYLEVSCFSVSKLKEAFEKSGIVIYNKGKELFADKNLDVQTLLSLMDFSDKDKTGYILSVTIGDTKILGDDFAKALHLNSTAIEVCECDEGVRVTTKGIGHGFGMSLAYAKRLAENGQKWQKILKTFYDASICNN